MLPRVQTFMMAVFDDASENIQNATGPIDDGYIANAVGSDPSDPYCCAGPEPLDDGELDAAPNAAILKRVVLHYVNSCSSAGPG